MNISGGQNNLPNKQTISHQQRPENKDNLDSRKNEEQQNKGDDVTHNDKRTKEHHLKEKK